MNIQVYATGIKSHHIFIYCLWTRNYDTISLWMKHLHHLSVRSRSHQNHCSNTKKTWPGPTHKEAILLWNFKPYCCGIGEDVNAGWYSYFIARNRGFMAAHIVIPDRVSFSLAIFPGYCWHVQTSIVKVHSLLHTHDQTLDKHSSPTRCMEITHTPLVTSYYLTRLEKNNFKLKLKLKRKFKFINLSEIFLDT